MKAIIQLICYGLLCVIVNPSAISQEFQDCTKAFPICKTETYLFKQMEGPGLINDKLPGLTCSEKFFETNSFWLTWEIQKSGILTFIIDPIQSEDDFDFILFRSSVDCDQLNEVRCMVSGDEIGQKEQSPNCKGSTGLDIVSMDTFEKSGCKYNDDNFLKFLDTEAGERYYLLLNNYDSSQGFTISLDGTTELQESVMCQDKSITNPIEIVAVYPNPAQGLLNIDMLSLNKTPIQIEVLDLLGNTVVKWEENVKQGNNTIKYQIDQLHPGSYLIKVRQDEFASIKQFIKQ